jgi:hypothetical protein
MPMPANEVKSFDTKNLAGTLFFFLFVLARAGRRQFMPLE